MDSGDPPGDVFRDSALVDVLSTPSSAARIKTWLGAGVDHTSLTAVLPIFLDKLDETVFNKALPCKEQQAHEALHGIARYLRRLNSRHDIQPMSALLTSVNTITQQISNLQEAMDEMATRLDTHPSMPDSATAGNTYAGITKKSIVPAPQKPTVNAVREGVRGRPAPGCDVGKVNANGRSHSRCGALLV
jgi:uncharacterized membrane protein YccC